MSAARVALRTASLALAFAVVVATAPAVAGAAKVKEPRRQPELERAERARILMGTLCTAVAEAHDSAAAGLALDEALDEIARLERVLSSWDGSSELSRLNAAGPETRVTCSADLWEVVTLAFETARETDGAFDPTVEPLVRAWDLRGEGRLPEPLALREARDATGWQKPQLETGTRTVRFPRPGMGLDLAGIGKGHAIDRALELLRQRGVRRAMLNLGGEVGAFSPPGSAWTVSVAHPADRMRPAMWLAVAQGAVSTSSQIERGVTVEGVHHGHVLDPRTGRPVPTEASVTVVTRSGARADALSTALLVMGRENAERFAEGRRDIGVLWMEPDGSTVRAWRWNLPSVRPDPRAVVRWMD